MFDIPLLNTTHNLRSFCAALWKVCQEGDHCILSFMTLFQPQELKIFCILTQPEQDKVGDRHCAWCFLSRPLLGTGRVVHTLHGSECIKCASLCVYSACHIDELGMQWTLLFHNAGAAVFKIHTGSNDLANVSMLSHSHSKHVMASDHNQVTTSAATGHPCAYPFSEWPQTTPTHIHLTQIVYNPGSTCQSNVLKITCIRITCPSKLLHILYT